ncbi:MAG: hypothetical protein LBU89_04100 [Fibromonadaceae bacterium]|nr:hypothetical protein [Fibromonadaceae bacterium]
MNASDITTRVADLVRNPDSAMPSRWEHSVQKKLSEPVKLEVKPSREYSLALSPLAQKILEDSDSHQSSWEKNRNEGVQRIQQLVQDRQYHLSPEIVDGIAQKIVDMLP